MSDDLFALFDSEISPSEALSEDVAAFASSDAGTCAGLLLSWRTREGWLHDVCSALLAQSPGSDDPDCAVAAFWQRLLETAEAHAPSELPAVRRRALEAAVDSSRFDAALALARAARDTAPEGSAARATASLDLASVQLSSGVHDEGPLLEVLHPSLDPALHKRVLTDLGVVRLASGHHTAAFATWREVQRTMPWPVAAGSPTGPSNPGGLRDIRQCLQSELRPDIVATRGLGGPRMVAYLYAFAAHLRAVGQPGATTVEAEAMGRLLDGLGAWAVIDEETGDTTEDLVEEIIDILRGRELHDAVDAVQEALDARRVAG